MTHLPTLGACSALSAFPPAVPSHLDLSSPPLSPAGPASPRLSATPVTGGALSRDATLCFLRQGRCLEVLDARTNERVAAWTFGGPGDLRGDAAAAKAAEALSPGKVISGRL